jgi:UDP-N-acetylmuramoylalanine--D-glutamate ligase
VITSFGGKRVVLLGIARTNIALARFLVAQGADVTAYDDKPADQLRARLDQLSGLPIRLALGGADLAVVDAADQLFVTPGASREHPLVRRAAERGLPVASEIELLFDLCPVPIAAITGSAGKTTTTTLAGEMLRRSGLPTFVGGNIGTPLIDRLDRLTPDARVVLELSSYQLEHLRRGPQVGAILNVTPNHLDRHPSFEHYRDAKANLIAHQRHGDVAVLGLDDPVAASLVGRGAGRKLFFSLEQPVVEGAFRHGERLFIALGDLEGTICRQPEVRLRGEHNVRNVLAAALIAAVRGASLEAIREVATTFEGIEHRIEPVRTLDGAAWFNDSKATSPAETIAALRSFAEPVVLLAGGRSKNAPLDEMAAEILARARALIVFGEMADEIEAAIRAAPGGERLEVRRAPSLAVAVALAREAARPGDAVLLSPSGASFDAFEDYEHRGRVFKQLVGALPARAASGER